MIVVRLCVSISSLPTLLSITSETLTWSTMRWTVTFTIVSCPYWHFCGTCTGWPLLMPKQPNSSHLWMNELEFACAPSSTTMINHERDMVPPLESSGWHQRFSLCWLCLSPKCWLHKWSWSTMSTHCLSTFAHSEGYMTTKMTKECPHRPLGLPATHTRRCFWRCFSLEGGFASHLWVIFFSKLTIFHMCRQMSHACRCFSP